MQNEAFSRVLIDKELEFSGWNLLNPKLSDSVEVEDGSGMGKC